MSTAMRRIEHGTIARYTVATGQAVTKGELVVLASDTTVQDAGGASDLGIGIAMATVAADLPVDIYLFAPVIDVAVGTGGATRGKKAIHAADGFTDCAAHDSSGATDNATYGVFMQSGVVGDRVGMQAMFGNRGSA